MAADQNILIVAESAGGVLSTPTCELLALAQRLKQSSGGEIAALLLGDDTQATLQALTSRGADSVFHAGCADLAALTSEARLPSIAAAGARAKPALVLVAHNVLGAELGPRLAFRMGAAAATGCVDVAIEQGVIRCTRPCYGGLAREVTEYANVPVVATIRPGLFEPAPEQAGRDSRVYDLGTIDPGASPVRVLKRDSEAGQGVRLEDARVVVAGGRGLEGPEGFGLLRELADELGGAVGSSRVPCDLGWCPHSWQIGLTGKTVTPELYIAVGISGAGHHMAGCGNAKAIVAINSDPEAAIFQDARFGVVGDYREVLPALVAQVRKLKQQAA